MTVLFLVLINIIRIHRTSFDLIYGFILLKIPKIKKPYLIWNSAQIPSKTSSFWSMLPWICTCHEIPEPPPSAEPRGHSPRILSDHYHTCGHTGDHLLGLRACSQPTLAPFNRKWQIYSFLQFLDIWLIQVNLIYFSQRHQQSPP